MAKPRKTHVQQAIQFPDKNGQKRGRRKGVRYRGKRPGRRPKNGRAGTPHTPRPVLRSYNPVHVILRVTRELGSLRKRHMYEALREATLAVAKRELNFAEEGAFRIVHVSIQNAHIHLIVEAAHRTALSRGMQSLQISAAKHINRAYSEQACLARRRRGRVFVDRYYAEIITSPRQARHTLSYVLNNWRKHQEDRRRAARSWNVDPFSTGALFEGWKGREDATVMWRWPRTYEPLIVYLPKTWLLTEGWRRHGRIGFDEVPSRSPGN